MGWSGEMFQNRAMILQADSHDVSLVKNIIGALLLVVSHCTVQRFQ